MNVFDIILAIVYIVVGAALVWFVVELALTMRKTRSAFGELKDQLDPLLVDAKQITEDIQPAVKKVDPLMDSVSLTVDAVNLEMMRVDGILENVGDITSTATKAVDTVDAVTSAPLNLVNSITDKFRSRVSPKRASAESVQLGKDKAAADVKAAAAATEDALHADIEKGGADSAQAE